MTGDRDPLVLPQDEFDLVRKVYADIAAAYGDGIDWKARAERAEAKLNAIAEHCRDRIRRPGRSGMSLGAATVILGIIGSEEGDHA